MKELLLLRYERKLRLNEQRNHMMQALLFAIGAAESLMAQRNSIIRAGAWLFCSSQPMVFIGLSMCLKNFL